MTWTFRGAPGVLALVLALSGPALADKKPTDKDKVPDGQGTGKGVQEEKQKNPLPELVEQMKQVERRIAESDSGKWTTEEQQRIVDALDLEAKVVDGLQKLIEEIESRPPSGSGSSTSRDQPKPGGTSKDKESGQPKERQQDGQQQPVDPQAREKAEKEAQAQRERQAQNDKRSEGEPASNDYKLDRSRNAEPGKTWGQLPPKQSREVYEAKRRELPQQWRKQLEDYFRKLSEPKK